MPTDYTFLVSKAQLGDLSEYSDHVTAGIEDIKASWEVILISVFIAFVIGFVYLGLLKCFSGLIVWSVIFAMFIVLMILATGFYNQAQTKESAEDYIDYDSKEGNLAIAYIIYALAAILFLGILCFYDRIKLAIAIVKTTSDYVSDTRSIVLVPFASFFVYLGFYALWISGFLYMYSKGEITPSANEYNPFA